MLLSILATFVIIAWVFHTKEQIMATLQNVMDDLTTQSTQIEAVAATVADIKKQLADALANVTLPPEVQAEIDSVFAKAEANGQALAAIVAPPV